jgi:apolipoprotein N-acyltransferase
VAPVYHCRTQDLKALHTMGFSLPSPGYLWGAIVFGLLGFSAYRRGRKTEQMDLAIVGVVLMLYPYVIYKTWLVWTIGVALSVWAISKWSGR